MSSHPSRRTFLKVAGSSLLASGLSPVFVHAESKSGNRPAVIGSGDWKFECHHNWGEVPDHLQWKDTHGVAVDKEGLVYITHRGNTGSDTVAVFDPQGKFVRSFGKEYAGGGHGIDIRDEGGTESLYLSINAPHRLVVKCDKQGNVAWKRTTPDESGVYGEKGSFSPTNVCFGPQGELFVGDGYGAHYLHQYDSNGKWLRSWGGPGAQAGQFKTPHGQWLDTRQADRPLIVVADRANVRLQWLTFDGEPVRILQGVKDPEQHGKQSELKSNEGKTVPVTSVYGISFPASVDSQGEFLLIADLHARVLILNGQNELVSNLGFSEEWTTQVLADKMKMRTSPEMWQNGKFVHPHDACFDQAGNLFVTEWVSSGRVTFLKRLG